ncbi:zinc finger protein-domain-containing protein [Penicillium cosmopolitanum]|uniref:Zinc finger protein-domain-containing protein n=1 Tax=Penicillium cosmopolitanum TaxID=1131564 RepID=A0A9X0B9S9_9EURO|nr:zinc finger protein-domain-containing protein [Penicillium cosmopolitanum]KAJ5397009.1 zinc finger protein-domain-containing protein [Penicillium cosmopolitanum]
MEGLRRAAQHSSKESPIFVTSSLRSNINLSNELSAMLDQHHNETVINDLELNECSSPVTILSRVLAPKSYSSTASSFALFQQTQQPLPFVEYRVIGFGQCGLIFEKPGQGYVLKVAKRSYEDALWADLKAHLRVQEAFDNPQNNRIECRVPRLYSYVPKGNNVWWERNMNLFPPVHDSITLPAMTLVSERILPIPKIAREALISKYCSAESRAFVAANPTDRDCLARVYLGRRRVTTTPPPNFTLRNFNLHLDQMIDLKYPVHSLAAAIGEALAIIHWSANVDAYDIEFVLGSEGDRKYGQDVLASLTMSSDDVAAMAPHTDIESLLTVNFMRRTTRLWVLDFNLCNGWDEAAAIDNPDALVAHLVESFFENDPYYPLPLTDDALEQKLWDVFRSSYIEKASQVLDRKDGRLAGLPRNFINGCIRREKESLEKGLGHGHREAKQ